MLKVLEVSGFDILLVYVSYIVYASSWEIV